MRLRFRLRTLMILIALMALPLGAGIGFRRRGELFARLTQEHNREADRLEKLFLKGKIAPTVEKVMGEMLHWHSEMAAKYGYAASHPWLPVPPDPPKPK